jgi:hypothetical protein
MARCGGRKQAASPFGCSVPNVVTERDGLKILATVFSGNNECEKQDSSTGCRLRRASRKPSLFSRYLCVCQSPSLGKGCAAGADGRRRAFVSINS